MKVYKFKNWFFILIIFLLNCKTIEVKKKNKWENDFQGKIVFEVTTKIENEERFDKELNSFIKTKDSLHKLNNPNDDLGSIASILRLELDPRENPSNFNAYRNPQLYVYRYFDTLVSYTFSNFKVEINTLTNDYKRYNIRTNNLVKSKKHSFYESERPYKKIIYKDSIKNISGFNCYKVLVYEELSNNNSKRYKEMYVTEEINSLYHPAQIRKEFLKKYYPLEIKVYSDFLKDKVTYFKAKLIEKSLP